MYTLEEINEKARSKGLKAFCKIFLFFGIGFPIIGIFAMLFFEPSVNADKESVFEFLLSFLPVSLICGLFGGLITYILVSYGTKNKMKEENKQEEQQDREEHYKHMEELLEKMSKEKENA